MVVSLCCASTFAGRPSIAADSARERAEPRFINLLKGLPDSPYRISLGLDLSMAGTSASLQLLSRAIHPKFTSYTAEELALVSENEVSRFDRSAIGPIRRELDLPSYITNGLAFNYVWLLFIGRNVRYDFTKVLVMYAQAYLMFPLATEWTQPIVARKRPYFYSEETDIDERLSVAAQRSFVSGHANYGFCFAVMFAELFRTYYPDSPWRFVMYPLALGTAGSTLVLRYVGHYHYPTDLIAGAATGSFVGWFVPFTHRRRERHPHVVLEPIIGRCAGLRVRFPLPRT
jgi:membrane-associated phospholipid phosphatase